MVSYIMWGAAHLFIGAGGTYIAMSYLQYHRAMNIKRRKSQNIEPERSLRENAEKHNVIYREATHGR